jgi:HD-GYP domain-containing protein (c-di-GMP phosphodiesterase class II)
VESKTSDMPVAGPGSDAAPQGGRLLVASRLATVLSRAATVESVAREAVRTLHDAFDYPLAVVRRFDGDGRLHAVAAAGPPAEEIDGFLAVELPIVVAESSWGVLNLEQPEDDACGEEDLLLAHVIAGQIGAAIHRCQLVDELEDAFLTTIAVISDAVEMQDAYTANHAEAVGDLCVAVGERMGIGGIELDRLRYGALLHDVGKIGIPAEILRKPGPLTPEERARMDEHTAIGARMLERIPFLAPVAPLVRSAHERHDGGGYPDGLAGEEIPPEAMVIATCDAFHAMTSDRTYRKALSVADAEAELRANSGTQFEPGVVEALLAELAAGHGPGVGPAAGAS